MLGRHRPDHPLLRGAALLLVGGALLAGCGGGSSSTSATTAAKDSKATMSAETEGMEGMEGMEIGGESGSTGMSVDGIKPVPTQTLGSATWQGMKITARAMTAVPFVTYNGTSEHMVKPGPKASFHLMVFLNDARTKVVIPYASVWATIKQGSKVVFDERQWPMLSRYMGPHYGNDVTLPGAGNYKLTLLISPPVSARHLEYQHVWLKPHRVSFTFPWKPSS